MVIFVDSREKPRATSLIMEEFDRQCITHYSTKLFVGDYNSPSNPNLFIDRKQNLQEVCSNVVQDHDRFVREIERANQCGYHVIVLIEHGGQIRSLPDVIKWKNPRLKKSPLAVSGERLFKIMSTMAGKYGFEWAFCDKRQTGKKIIEILGGDQVGS